MAMSREDIIQALLAQYGDSGGLAGGQAPSGRGGFSLGPMGPFSNVVLDPTLPPEEPAVNHGPYHDMIRPPPPPGLPPAPAPAPVPGRGRAPVPAQVGPRPGAGSGASAGASAGGAIRPDDTAGSLTRSGGAASGVAE